MRALTGATTTRGPAPFLAAIGLAAGMLTLGAAPASAHALCGETSPARNATLDRPPSDVWCEFNEPPTPNSSIEVYDGCEQRVDTRQSLVVGFRITVGVEAEDPGTYTVVWKTVSAKDGHPAFGSHTFTVRGVSPCAPPSQGQGSGGGGTKGAGSKGGDGQGGSDGPSTGGGKPQPGTTTGATPPPNAGGSSSDGGAGDDGGSGSGIPTGQPGGIPGTGGVAIGNPVRPSVGWPLAALLAVVLPFGLMPVRALRRRDP